MTNAWWQMTDQGVCTSKNKIHTTVYLKGLSKYCETAFTDLSRYNYIPKFWFWQFSIRTRSLPFHTHYLSSQNHIRMKNPVDDYMYLTQTAQHPWIYCHPFQHISLQTNNTKESLTAELGSPFPHLCCNRGTLVRIGSLFLILQLPNIISTIRSNNQHQRFRQQILPPSQTLLTTDRYNWSRLDS
jgi:hypothetical protein